MNPEQIRRILTAVDGLSEVQQTLTFCCRRRSSDTEFQILTVEVFDSGPERASLRFECRVTSDDGRTVTGHAEATLEGAIGSVNWDALG